MTLRIIVVDDEPLARKRMRRLVEQVAALVGGAEIVGEAGDAEEAAALIRIADPDVVLLDIRMPGRDGVAFARELGDRPAIIFCTAHGEFAIEAFDAAAVDYLMKPVASDKLARALERARSRLAAATATPAPPRITARAGQVITVVAVEAIARFRAEDKYTVFVVDGVEHLIEVSLTELEARLERWGFLRVHRAELVQLAKIKALHATEAGAELELATGERVPVSRRQLAAVRRHLA